MLTCRDQQAAAYKGSRKINRFILSPIHPTKSSLRRMGGIFLLRETHLENFMSRPNVIPTFRQHRCTNRGRNFVWSKR